MELYIFNPDTDMALAHFDENYMSPASARCMAQDLALLPLWYAPDGSFLLAPSAYNLDFLNRMHRLFPLSVQLVTEPELSGCMDVHIHPWGWNPVLRKQLLRNGVPEERLPMREWLQRYRELSGRHVALEVLSAFDGEESCCGTGVCLHTLSACERYLHELGHCLFKIPWSGSGKGLLWCYSGFKDPVAKWCEHALSEQGFLIGMPVYGKVLDFAMEFYADGHGQIRFVGYSLFKTSDKGAYLGNCLESNEYIEQQIAGYVPLSVLDNVRTRLQEKLSGIYIGYLGYIGVDMMVCQSDRTSYGFAIFPCVEINVRMNMGVVARLFYDRFMPPLSNGMFCVEAFSTAAGLQEAHRADEIDFPPIIRDGKLFSGYLPLVPVTPRSRYRAFVRVVE